jgi:UDP-glucose 4-epimerase
MEAYSYRGCASGRREARGKRILFTGERARREGTSFPGSSEGLRILNFDLKPFDHPGIHTLIGDITDEAS